jgi:hypothetical protein
MYIVQCAYNRGVGESYRNITISCIFFSPDSAQTLNMLNLFSDRKLTLTNTYKTKQVLMC